MSKIPIGQQEKTKGSLMGTDGEDIFLVISLLGSPGKRSDF